MRPTKYDFSIYTLNQSINRIKANRNSAKANDESQAHCGASERQRCTRDIGGKMRLVRSWFSAPKMADVVCAHIIIFRRDCKIKPGWCFLECKTPRQRRLGGS